MNKAGYIISLIGGVFAMLFSVMLIVTGPYFVVADDADAFLSDNADDIGVMWTRIGDYYKVGTFFITDFDDYADGYLKAFRRIDERDLEDIGEEYDIPAFDDLAEIYEDVEDYIPLLMMGVIGSMAGAVIALIGAAVARRYRTAGGAMVLSGAALTLIFSLVAGSIVPMALASLLLIMGGVFQITKPRSERVQTTGGALV